ncbi:uncharacterized protein [Clytia hemisphaerica]|uniref:Cnidarian restricted protein n=1 Tax=Clytia hemisphaerica TaxID=252671 RepID=A0A7M5X8Q2_9CNID
MANQMKKSSIVLWVLVISLDFASNLEVTGLNLVNKTLIGNVTLQQSNFQNGQLNISSTNSTRVARPLITNQSKTSVKENSQSKASVVDKKQSKVTIKEDKKDIGQNIQKDLSTKSEIYKMHSNGLMLLHPQRSSIAKSSKKSKLASSSSDDSAVNYHIWKKPDHDKTTNQSSAIVENEKFLETKLGNLPQIQEGKRETTTFSENCLDTDPIGGKPCNVDEESNEKQDYLRRKRESILQRRTSTEDRESTLNRETRNEDDPLFDDDQPEEILRREKEKRRLIKLKSRYGTALSRGIPDIPAIKPIPDIQSRFEKIEPLETIPRFGLFGPEAYDNWPRFGVPDLSLMHYPRFPAPKMDEFEQIPGIPHIRPLSRGDEVTGDRRGYPAKNDDFYDQELDEDIEHNSPITSPTAIPSLTNIPDIPDIQDIPTISPARAAARKSSNGQPAVDTIHTKDGDETRVST